MLSEATHQKTKQWAKEKEQKDKQLSTKHYIEIKI